MLNFSGVTAGMGGSVDAAQIDGDIGLNFGKLARAGRRQIWIIAICCIVGLCTSLAYLWTAVPRYTATAVVFFESAKDKGGLAASIADLVYDSGAIDSQLEVLRSEGVAQAVINNLKLAHMNTEPPPPPGFFRRLRAGLAELVNGAKTTEPTNETAARQHALIKQLQSSLEVRRVGRSYVVNISYTSDDPDNAARYANAFAEAYISDQLESRYDSLQRSAALLERRISELKEKSMRADLIVEQFKFANGILTYDGKLVSDLQVSELSSQLVRAKSDLAQADAKFMQITDLIQKEQAGSVVTDTLGNEVINALRRKMNEMAVLEDQLSSTFGPGHPQAQKLRRDMAESSRQIRDEMTRIASAYRSDADVARAKLATMEKQIGEFATKRGASSDAIVQLRELQRQADSYRNIYGSFLQRLQQVQEQQSFPGSEARVITYASPPDFASQPRRMLSVVLCLFLGGLVGVGFAAVSEMRDGVFRTAAQVRNGLQMEFLGVLPSIEVQRRLPLTSIQDQSRTVGVGASELKLSGHRLSYAVDHPATIFAETLRSVKVAVDHQLGAKSPKCVGVLSITPDEGASVVANNLASLMARHGDRVLLIDGNLHGDGLTQAIAPDAAPGLLEVLRGECTLHEALIYESNSGLFVLPAPIRQPVVDASYVLSSDSMRRVLAEAGQRFQYIIIDLPPICPYIDARAAVAAFDAFLLVLAWGRTREDLARSTLASEKDLASRCLGALYYEVPLDKMRLYEDSGERHIHMRACGFAR